MEIPIQQHLSLHFFFISRVYTIETKGTPDHAKEWYKPKLAYG